MVKGKPWDLDDEKKLIAWFRSGTNDLRVLAFSFDGKYTEEAIRQKLINLELLKEQQQWKNVCCCSSKLELPEELPSIEETLKTLAAALESLKMPGLEKNDVFRLRCIISGAKVYKDLLSDYINYRELEAELLELREKYGEFSKKSLNLQFLIIREVQKIMKVLPIVILAILCFSMYLVVSPNELGQQSFPDDWTMFHHDLTHTGYPPSIAPQTNQVAWIYPITGIQDISSSAAGYKEVYSSPAIADGLLYVGIENVLYVINAATGNTNRISQLAVK